MSGNAAPAEALSAVLYRLARDPALTVAERAALWAGAAALEQAERTGRPPPIPHHQLRPYDVLRWQCPAFPQNVHRWRVFGCCHGGMGQESLIECESLTHSPGWTGEGCDHRRVFIPEVLVRSLVIEDVGEQFGLQSSRHGAP